MPPLRPTILRSLLAVLALSAPARPQPSEPGPPAEHPTIAIRGIYGGVPTQIFDRGRTLADYGVNAIWIGSGSVTRERSRA